MIGVFLPGMASDLVLVAGRAVVHLAGVVLLCLAAYALLAPFVLLLRDLSDAGLRNGQVPRSAYRRHRALATRFEAWAHRRVASGKAARLNVANISGTEWPIFSAVFFLWATESLQEAWEARPTGSAIMPKELARGAIEAAVALICDPNHAAWVQRHWGVDYLERENVFYRMLLISGLTSYQKLLGDDRHQALLARQVASLSAELDASPHGLLDDYPGQCYPIDILPAIAAIRRADAVLGTDHTAFAARAQRGFQGSRLDPSTALPAYVADARTGRGLGRARGVGIATMLTWVPALWPDTAQLWYARYEEHFWRRTWLLAGVREFSAAAIGQPAWNLGDVDSGPVLAGFGTAASAFGIGAARANGRFDHAFPLAAEALVASWPLPNGTLLAPRLLSNLADAPYLGEACWLFQMTRTPAPGTPTVAARSLPLVVYCALAAYVGASAMLIWLGYLLFRHAP